MRACVRAYCAYCAGNLTHHSKICLGQRRRVIHAIPNHTNHLSSPLQRRYLLALPSRPYLRPNMIRLDTELPGDSSSAQLIVAREDPD